ncbi:ATP-binding cassette domain-containing protein|uniref:ABC-2 type transport system ATP-binding protein n=1 Tax=Dendrosporobacter quercicolus TaxID=146817 RepID=A0A1G9P5M9_9FIRM|nr:ATP-binding cassette domain-containing protein [Dendrosporobacter quercicolus]NSL47539.1 ATP-binding cassette domain-containing protein [Dendrosporobacter quercicolus DSM 1736]SDL93537.1 ABC-2 type transport system ATP-binding protein [Dendrosporobacter quercicolus]
MSEKALTDTFPTASAVSLCNVTKHFTQWQRDNSGKGILRNLIKPEKKVIAALSDVSFGIRKGEFVAYAGPNGAGKSTTMKLLSGMLLPTSGEISVLSMSPQKQRRELMAKLGVLFGNRTELWWDHPVIQSFEWKKVVWNIPEPLYRKNLDMVTELLDIGGLLRTFARELSLGQRMRADLAMMLLHSPEIILLDEPTLGLDVVAKRQMIDFLKKLNREDGVTIIVTSHDMDDLEEMAQRILMISDGKIAYDGDFDGLRKITGNLTRVVVTTENGFRPELQNATLLSSENGVHEFELDLAQTPIKTLMRLLSEFDGVCDVEIKKAPIEQVIASVYASWK